MDRHGDYHTEKDLEDFLSENPEILGIDHWISRQATLPIGRLDLIGATLTGCIVLVELKATSFAFNHIAQLFRYQRALEDIANANGYVPVPISKMLVVNQCSIDGLSLFDIMASETMLVTYCYRDGMFVFDTWHHKRTWHERYADKCNKETDFTKIYLKYVNDNQPEWIKEMRSKNNER